jgi:cellulose synthase (UDP-forming)
VYKQRGTWALDTMRLLFWGDLRGLSVRQWLHFAEMGLFYLLGPTMIIFMCIPLVNLVFHVYPLASEGFAYPLHFGPYVIAMEWFLAVLRGRRPYRELWRARQLLWGLTPVYASACLLALLGGAGRKPVYRVTRKVSCTGWYWRETLAHVAIVTLLGAALMYRLGCRAANWQTQDSFDVGSAFWAAAFMLALASFIHKGWYGLDWRSAALVRLQVVSRCQFGLRR